MPEPVANEEGMITFGRISLHVKSIYGLSPEQFLEIHRKIVKKGLETPFEIADYYITFELYCHELLSMDYDFSTLISEFNITQKENLDDVPHCLSLAKLCYHYVKHGYDVEIIKTSGKDKSPDLMINEIRCDLKVRYDQINRDMRNYLHLLEEDEELYHRIHFSKIRTRFQDLKSALENRALKGFEQADCLIFDLSNHFHSWNYHRINSYIKKYQTKEFSQKPLDPIPYV
jgi:hypothetical protein